MKSINVCRLTNIHSTHHHIVNVHRTLTTIVVRHHMRQAEIPVQFQWNDDTKKKTTLFSLFSHNRSWFLLASGEVPLVHWLSNKAHVPWNIVAIDRDDLMPFMQHPMSTQKWFIRQFNGIGNIYIYDKCRYARCARHRVQTKKKNTDIFLYLIHKKKIIS